MELPDAQRPGERVFTALMLLFGVFMLWHAYRIAGFTSPSSAGVFPMIATATLVVSGLVIVLQTWRRAAEAGASGVTALLRFQRQITPPVLLGFTALIVAYMVALEPAGFLLASFVFLIAAMFLLGRRRILFNLMTGLVSIALIQLVFRTVFAVALPRGQLMVAWPW